MADEFRDAVRRGYDALGRAYHEERSAADPAVPLLDRAVGALDDGARVLDAGCGAGEPFTALLAERFEVVGLDVSRTQLELARHHVPEADPVQGDMTRLGFVAGTFDGLAALYSVIHVPREDHAAVFEEFRRVLRPGAPALLVVGTAAWEGRNPDWLESGVEMRWSFHDPETTLDILRDAGFEIHETETIDDDLGGEFLTVLARAG